MKMRLHLVILVALVAASLSSPRAVLAAPVLAVDFGAIGIPAQAGFQELSGTQSQPTADATLGGYTINLVGQGFGTASAGHSGAIDQSVRSLYRDYYYNNSETPGVGVTLSIGNVTPNHAYDLTVWSYDGDQNNPTDTTWSPTGANTTGGSGFVTNVDTPRPATLSDYSTTFQVTSTTSTLDIFGTSVSGPGGTRLNGFRLKDGATDVLSVDLGQPSIPPSPVQAGFSGMSGDFPLGPNTPPPSLAKTFGSYTVTVSGDPYQGSDYSRIGFEDNSGSAAAIDPSIRALYEDSVFNNLDLNDGSGLNLSIQGVTPNTQYKLKLWSYNADNTIYSTPTSFGPRAGSATTGTSGSVTQFATPLPATLDDHSVTITVSSTTSVLDIHAASTMNYGGTRLNAFELSLATAPIPGDFNGNGSVNGVDLSIWRSNFGATADATVATGDADDDHDVDGTDFLIWQRNYSGGTGVAAVPEPSSAVILALAGAATVNWRRRSLRQTP